MKDLPPIVGVVTRLADFFDKYPVNSGVQFNDYRPARLFVGKTSSFRPKLSNTTLGRFENAFNQLNTLLSTA